MLLDFCGGMDILRSVCRARRDLGVSHSKVFSHSLLKLWKSPSDDSVCNREGYLAREKSLGPARSRGVVQKDALRQQSADTAEKHLSRFCRAKTETQRRDRWFIQELFQFARAQEFLSGGCKILKQSVDRKRYQTALAGCKTEKRTSSEKHRSLTAMEKALSRSEAKFFLDSNDGSWDIDRKISGVDFERAKFHLQAFRNLLNCRSYVFGRGRVRPTGSACARLRKAESPKQGLTEKRNQQHQASGITRLSGVFLFSTNREESDLGYGLETEI